MDIVSYTFLLFITVVIVIYFLLPPKYQWISLLAASFCFYVISAGRKSAVLILLTAATVYLAALLMQKQLSEQKAYLKEHKNELSKEEKRAVKARYQKRRKLIMLAALLLNIGLLCLFKYSSFAVEQLNILLSLFTSKQLHYRGVRILGIKFLVPLGISFYTFQAVGYLLDVYWERTEPEKNFFRFVLFISFFPQITQGPISNFKKLSAELFTPHTFLYKNFAYGSQRMLWGFFKKLIVANIMGMYVDRVFTSYMSYTGITTFLGALCYSVQIYADFSGYMDIMCGLCEIMGIQLTENFDRPYFSRSIAEYWRRWHISLGDWFKNYIYYPMGMSNMSRSIAKYAKQKYGNHFSQTLPATIALLVVWTSTGLWHGANWRYITWGLVNGIFIIFSMWMEPVYAKWIRTLHIPADSFWWKSFQVLRTFLLVTIIKVLPEVGTLRSGLGLWYHVFTEHTLPSNVRTLLAFVRFTNLELTYFCLAICGTCMMFAVSVIQSRYKVRDVLNRIPWLPRLLLLSALTFMIITYGAYGLLLSGGGGFLYAQF